MTKTYKVTLKTIGPLHVGSGITLRKTEYIYDNYKNIVLNIDQRKLARFLNEKKLLNKFLDYATSNNKRNDLKTFLYENHVKQSEWLKFTTNEIKVNKGIYDKSTKPFAKHMNDYATMIRNGANEVYIPGSSLKGALRTILVNPSNHLMSQISVSDSNIVDHKDLSVFQKVDIVKKKLLYRYLESALYQIQFWNLK